MKGHKPSQLRLSMATSFWSRLKGLIGVKHLEHDEGICFPQCKGVHTFFMHMPITVIFCDKEGKIIQIIPRLKPWSWAYCAQANIVIEIAPITNELDNNPQDIINSPFMQSLQMNIYAFFHCHLVIK
ncbi:hypothetical protein V757_00295 [Pelistega indica]|uniref:DUF192 domain-containing protein n=1 Tax=Pelistega indica TaxID=1414851 RepID=V8GBF6_9BURK|nr:MULTISPECIES: DUF192 domain-containing protein [Pelistega]ETD73082.1 hypothetical protein V757_00295 [Pelistega indica]